MIQLVSYAENKIAEPVLLSSRLSCLLQSWHSISVAAMPPIQFPVNLSRNAVEDITHVRDTDGVTGSWPQPDLVLAVVAIWGVNQKTEDLYHSLSLSLCL